MMKTKWYALLVVGYLLALVACKPQANTLVIAGSRSVMPVVEVLADSFKQNNTQVQIDIQGVGSSAGVTAASEGAADIGMVSRRLKEDEPQLVETIIAYDGVAIIVHPNNPVDNLTMEQLRAIYAGKITNWADVGGNDAEIVLIDKEEGSGTRDVFMDLVMDETPIADSAIVMDGTGAARAAVAADPNAIGYISFAAVTPEVKALTIDGVPASPEAVLAGNYIIYRPFVLVTQAEPSALAQQFLDYVQSPAGQAIVAQNDLIPVTGQ